MRRTQIQLDETTYQVLRVKAHQQRVSLAALIRELLHEELGIRPTGEARAEDFHFVGSGRSQPSKLQPISERHDEALAEDFSR